MRLFARPGVVAAILVLAAAVLHPAIRSQVPLLRGQELVAVVCLLAIVVLAARALRAPAEARTGAALLALGAAVTLGAVGYDGARGLTGTMELLPGQAGGNFEELGRSGRSLGLRPLGFTIGLERILPEGGVVLELPGRSAPTALTPDRAVGIAGFRLGRPRTTPTGEAERLTIGISGATGHRTVELVPGEPQASGDLVLSIEQYFPDFALDDQQQPYSRSRESRNPAALLTVRQGTRAFRVFVLGSLPGVHRVEELGLTFSLDGVEPQRAAVLDVQREPAALVALLGAVLAVAGVVWERWR